MKQARFHPHLRVVRDDRLPLAPAIEPRPSWLWRLAAMAVGLALGVLAFFACVGFALLIGGWR